MSYVWVHGRMFTCLWYLRLHHGDINSYMTETPTVLIWRYSQSNIPIASISIVAIDRVGAGWRRNITDMTCLSFIYIIITWSAIWWRSTKPQSSAPVVQPYWNHKIQRDWGKCALNFNLSNRSIVQFSITLGWICCNPEQSHSSMELLTIAMGQVSSVR